MRARLAEPDYQLVWPRALFIAEAAKLLNHRELKDWDDRCELLLEHVFVRGYEGEHDSWTRRLIVRRVSRTAAGRGWSGRSPVIFDEWHPARVGSPRRR